jgi:hypothetical protein
MHDLSMKTKIYGLLDLEHNILLSYFDVIESAGCIQDSQLSRQAEPGSASLLHLSR